MLVLLYLLILRLILSLSIWGSLMGMVGLIIALPLTTLIISYYKRFVLEQSKPEEATAPVEEITKQK